MIINKTSLVHYFREYCFFKVIRQNNDRYHDYRLMTGGDIDYGSDFSKSVELENKDPAPLLITTRNARFLHDQVLKQLSQSDFSSTSRDDFIDAMNVVFSGNALHLAYDFDSYNESYQSFKSLVDLSYVGDEYSVFASDPMAVEPFFPISPFDSSFSDRNFAMSSGCDLVYMDVSDFDSIDDLSSLQVGFNRRCYKRFIKSNDDVVFYERPYLFFVTDADIYGVSRFAEFFSYKDYVRLSAAFGTISITGAVGSSLLSDVARGRNVYDPAPWVDDGSSLSDDVMFQNIEHFYQRRRKETDVAVGLLRGLVNDNLPFSLSSGGRNDDVFVSIAGTDVRVSFLTHPTRQQYACQVFDGDVTYNYSTSKKERIVGPNGSFYRTAPYANITSEKYLSLVRFVLGQPSGFIPIDVNDVTFIGVGSNKRIIRMANCERHARVVYRRVVGNIEGDSYNNKVFLQSQRKSSTTNCVQFSNRDFAENFVRDAIETARSNFRRNFNVDQLFADRDKLRKDASFSPIFSSDPIVAKYQEMQWLFLTGPKRELFFPMTGNVEIFERRDARTLNRHINQVLDYEIGDYELESKRGYKDSNKRFNVIAVSTYMSGGRGLHDNNVDLINALRLLDQSVSVIKNEDGSITPAKEAVLSTELKGSALFNDQITDRLIKFNRQNFINLDDLNLSSTSITDPYFSSLCNDPYKVEFYKDVKANVCDTLIDSGFFNPVVYLDDQSIVRYKAVFSMKQKVSDSDTFAVLWGDLGQIFAQDAHGVVRTQFAGSKNYACIPGYTATISHQVLGEHKSVVERTRLLGYRQQMFNRIKYQIRSDLQHRQLRTSVNDQGNHVSYFVCGSTTSCNFVFRKLYDTRFDLDFEAQFLEQGMSSEVLTSIVKTLSGRVKYDKAFADDATIGVCSRIKPSMLENNNFGELLSLVEGRNMAIMNASDHGYFDPVITGGSKNQGLVRYLVDGVTVDAGGVIQPARGVDGMIDLNARSSLAKLTEARFCKFDPFDRQQMVFSNLMKAVSVVNGVQVAQMTFGGWNQDDAIVVSNKFASTHKMRTHDGELRFLKKGDKLSDFHGNKGVISLIVDPDMRDDDAKAQGIFEQVQFFRANPDLDLVMAPFTSVSRFNGGSARECFGSAKPLIYPDGHSVDGVISSMNIIITDKSADDKTNIYSEDTLKDDGRARKFSSQLVWSFQAKGSKNILSEVFSSNASVVSDLREYLIVSGLDMDEVGGLRIGYAPHEGEVRGVKLLPEIVYKTVVDSTTNEIKITNTISRFQFRRDITNDTFGCQGFLEIPFPIKLLSNEYTLPLTERDGETGEKKLLFIDQIVASMDECEKKEPIPATSYALPVLPLRLRWSVDLVDGTQSLHNYTTQYLFIAECSQRYLDAVSALDDLYKPLSERVRFKDSFSEFDVSEQAKQKLYQDYCKREELRNAKQINDNMPVRKIVNYDRYCAQCNTKHATRVQKYENIKTTTPIMAQKSYLGMAHDIESRHLTGKHGMFRSGLMSRKLPNSATAILTSDPRLDIDQAGLSKEMATQLGVKNDDYVLIWRDPALRTGCARYVRIKIDPTLTGISISPATAKSFDADFDGDTYGVTKLKTKGAHRDAMREWTMGANLLDYSNVVGKDENGKSVYGLYMHNALDTKVACYYNDAYANRWDELTSVVNKFERAFKDGELTKQVLLDERKQAVADISDFYRDSYSNQCGKAFIRYDSMENHLQSTYDSCIKTGAKGNHEKLKDYFKYLGVECNEIVVGDQTTFDFSRTIDVGDTLATEKDSEDVQLAVSIKTMGTGVAGSFSQRGVAGLRGKCLDSVLEMTYVATQASVQSKHDPIQAKQNYDILTGACRSLWRGQKVEYSADEKSWKTVYENGKPVQLENEDEWTKQFLALFTSKEGFGIDVNPEHVSEVAMHLKGDGKMCSIEKTADDSVDVVSGRTLLDVMAYGGTFDDLVAASFIGENLFEGGLSSDFAPRCILKNQEIAKERALYGLDETKPFTSFSKKERDVKETVCFSKDDEIDTQLTLDPLLKAHLDSSLCVDTQRVSVSHDAVQSISESTEFETSI